MKKLINKCCKWLIFALIIYTVINCISIPAIITGNTDNIIKNAPLLFEILKCFFGILFFRFFCKVIFSFIGKY